MLVAYFFVSPFFSVPRQQIVAYTKQLDSPFTNNTNPKPQPRRQNSSTVSQNGGGGGDSVFATPAHQKQPNGGTSLVGSADKMPKNGVTTNGTENNKNGSASKDKNVDEGLVALRRQPSIRDRRKVGAWLVSDWCRCNNKNDSLDLFIYQHRVQDTQAVKLLKTNLSNSYCVFCLLVQDKKVVTVTEWVFSI